MDRAAGVKLVETIRDRQGYARWYVYSDGTRLPVIAGGDGTNDDGGAGGGASGGGAQGGGAGGNAGDGSQGGSGANGGQGSGGTGDGGAGGQGGQSGDGQNGGQGSGEGSGDADDTPTHTQREVDTIAQMERRRGFRKHVKDKYGLSAEDAERILLEHANGRGGTGSGANGGGQGGQGGSGQPADAGGQAGNGGAATPPPSGVNNPVWVASAERALLRAGFPADADDAAMRRAVRLLEVDDDADDPAEFRQAATALKKDMPALFENKGSGQGNGGSGNGGQGSGAGGTGTPSSTPGGTAPRPAPPADAKTRGAERAARDNARRGVKAPAKV